MFQKTKEICDILDAFGHQYILDLDCGVLYSPTNTTATNIASFCTEKINKYKVFRYDKHFQNYNHINVIIIVKNNCFIEHVCP